MQLSAGGQQAEGATCRRFATVFAERNQKEGLRMRPQILVMPAKAGIQYAALYR
jgi:hypothetical protein